VCDSCRLRDQSEGKKPTAGARKRKAATDPHDDDVDGLVRMAVERGIQSLAANDLSKQRKRKQEVVHLNGSVDDGGAVLSGNVCTLERCAENIPRKKRRKVMPSEREDWCETATEEPVDVKPTDAAVGGDDKSALEEEVEIWITNKKYKGPLADVYAKMAEKGSRKIVRNSPKEDTKLFMSFIPLDRTPTALVRRRNKLSYSEPKQILRSVSSSLFVILLFRRYQLLATCWFLYKVFG